MKKYLLVPPEDITALEITRNDLYRIVEEFKVSGTPLTPNLLHHITEPMWQLTHKKYRTTVDFAVPAGA